MLREDGTSLAGGLPSENSLTRGASGEVSSVGYSSCASGVGSADHSVDSADQPSPSIMRSLAGPESRPSVFAESRAWRCVTTSAVTAAAPAPATNKGTKIELGRTKHLTFLRDFEPKSLARPL